MNTSDINGVVRSAIHNSGGIKKSLLTPCGRIGLSRKRKNGNIGFNSPLRQENIDLNYESPTSKLVDDVKIKQTEPSITPLGRRGIKKPKIELNKGEDKTPDAILRPENVESGISKREKSKEGDTIGRAKLQRTTKKKLILESDSEEENCEKNPLNMSGCEPLGKEEKPADESFNKIMSGKVIDKPVVNPKNKSNEAVILSAKVSQEESQRKLHPKGKKKLIINSDSEEDSLRELINKQVNKPVVKNKNDVVFPAKIREEKQQRKVHPKGKKKLIIDSDSEEESLQELVNKNKDNIATTCKDKEQLKVHPKGKNRLIIESDSEENNIQELLDKPIAKNKVHANLSSKTSKEISKDSEKTSKDTLIKPNSSETSEKSKNISDITSSHVTDKKISSTKTAFKPITTMSPRTLQNLETKPLLCVLDSPTTISRSSCQDSTLSEIKVVVSKNSIDEYIKKKERQKNRESSTQKSKLSTKKTTISEDLDSDEEFLKEKSVDTSKNLENLHEKSALIEKILEIETRVKDKEIQLEKFKQAEVYHKLHNVQDLTKLTELWKNSCINALQDLLAKLREHANIDMEGLLQNLRAPRTLIKYDTENDCFL